MTRDTLAATLSRLSQRASWRRFASAIVLLISIAFLGWKAYSSWDSLRTYDWQIRYTRLVPSFALFLSHTAVVIWGWQSIMNHLAQRLPFRQHVKIYGLTNLMRRIPAGMLWVVAGRAYAYKDQEVPARVSALGSFLEMWLVVLTGLPLAALAASGLGWVSPSSGLALAVLAWALDLGMLHPDILSKLVRRARHQTLGSQLTYRITLCWAFIYTLIWLISGGGLFAMARLFADVPVQKLPATIGVWVLSSLISYFTLLSPSGLGVKELSLTFLLGAFLPDPLPLLTALAVRVVWTVYDLLVGLGASLL
jgi:hypothetical protein